MCTVYKTPAPLHPSMVSLDRERSVQLDRLLRRFLSVEAQLRALKVKIRRLDTRLLCNSRVASLRHEPSVLVDEELVFE